MTVRDFIKELGGMKAVCEFTGAPYTTVHAWVRTNKVPEWRMTKLAEMATRKGKPIPTTFEGQAA